jgi:protein phosphatase
MNTALTKAAGITDVGLKREENEDSFFADSKLGLFVVADGMGGHLAGEVASRTAVDLIIKSFQNWTSAETTEKQLFGHPDPALSRTGNYILSGIRLANKVIHEMAIAHSQYHGMGTTVAVLAVMPDLIVSANVGDSRIYMVRNGQMERLSKDHSIVAEQVEMGIMTTDEAQHSPLKHVLTKNLGSSENLDPEIYEIEPTNDDRFLLCTDGLTDLVTDDEIQQMVVAEGDPENLCRKFIDKALTRGGHDNTTVVSVYLTGFKKQASGAAKKIGGFFSDMLSNSKETVGKSER